ncbi:maleate cis-trans isomerase family protein [Desertibaculum subflavum]|uniref:maleate cis-trans isomerase family protein n=1 Tax=Desertibaculum subflavum TaxID=2268458 RepID=UPI000E675EE3
MTGRTLLGMLTPSSNTVLEPVTSAMLAGTPDITAHFGRFKVTEISLRDAALGQFDNAPILAAATLLADARVQAICWNGTSAGWLGLDADRELCAAIQRETGIPATSSTLALGEILNRTGQKSYGLVTPYLDEIQEKIVANFAREGWTCVAERHLRDKGNFSFSEYGPDVIARMVREVAAEKPQAIAVFCTNLRAAPLVEALEREIGIPIYDTVATAVWGSLRIAGVDPKRIKGWGRLFQEVA